MKLKEGGTKKRKREKERKRKKRKKKKEKKRIDKGETCNTSVDMQDFFLFIDVQAAPYPRVFFDVCAWNRRDDDEAVARIDLGDVRVVQAAVVLLANACS